MFEGVPEYAQSFQITGARFGFSGILLKPWSERTRNSLVIEQHDAVAAGAVLSCAQHAACADASPDFGEQQLSVWECGAVPKTATAVTDSAKNLNKLFIRFDSCSLRRLSTSD